jgi:hypothetical protein
VNKEPIPSNPSSGNGEAVWGSFCPAFAFWSELFALALAFWSEVLAPLWLLWAAFWSALVLLPEAAFWSLDDGVVLLAGGFCAVVLDEAEAAF